MPIQKNLVWAILMRISVEIFRIQLNRSWKQQVGKCAEEFSVLKARRDEQQDERKKLWKQEKDLLAELERLKTDRGKAEKSLDHAALGAEDNVTSRIQH
ncbi:hypothetical protein R1sor_000412 [Riccia sorocarpa]|uniref:Uncharacterized protein n=1 Tax=Riccia sorocarpa TaxID=122646 RepID=A0ABD3GW95_9MARC